jgi:molybdopterin-guanine dinucleotide biosynthesis protein A
MRFAAVVLAGGAARRLGGAPKPARTVAGVPLLIRVLGAVAAADARVVVGPPLPPDPNEVHPGDVHRAEADPGSAGVAPEVDGVRYTREEPPGGGPVAAVAAGIALLDPAHGCVAVLGADLPFLTPDAVGRLLRALDQHTDLAVYVDPAGHPQWLCGVWRRAALDRRLAEIGDPAGVGMRRLAEGLRRADVRTHEDGDGPPVWYDCDTEEDLRRAEEWAHGR